MVGLSQESNKVNPIVPSLVLSRKSCNIRGQSTHVKNKKAGSIGRLNSSAIDQEENMHFMIAL